MSSKYYGIEAARKVLGDLVAEAHQGTEVILTRGNSRRPVARIVPITEENTTMTSTTTSYGTWNDACRAHVSAEQTLEAYYADASPDWIERFEEQGYDLALADFRQAVADALPEGLILVGDEFIKTGSINLAGCPTTDEGRVDLTELVEGIDLGSIVDEHDPDNE